MIDPPPHLHAEPDFIPESERSKAMLCHLMSLAVYVFPFFGNIIGPLVVWLMLKNDSPAVDVAGRESLNFQITLTLLTFVGFILVFVGVGICVLLILPIVHLVAVIIATIKAMDGRQFRYPLTIRMI